MIGPGIMQAPMEPVPQLQHSKKFVEEEYASVVRQTPVVKGDSQVSWPSSHLAFHLTKCEVKGKPSECRRKARIYWTKPLSITRFYAGLR